MVAFAGHRVAAPADGTAIEVSAALAAGSVGAAVQIDRPGAGPIEAGDRIVAVLGRDLDALGRPAARPCRGPAGRRRRGPRWPWSWCGTAPRRRSRCGALPFDPIGAIAPSWGMLVLGLAFAASGVYAIVRRPGRARRPGGARRGHGPAGERGRPDARPPGARLRHRHRVLAVRGHGRAGLRAVPRRRPAVRARLPAASSARRRRPIGWRGWLVPALALLALAVGAGLDERTNAGGDRRLACRVGCPVDRGPRRGRGPPGNQLPAARGSGQSPPAPLAGRRRSPSSRWVRSRCGSARSCSSASRSCRGARCRCSCCRSPLPWRSRSAGATCSTSTRSSTGPSSTAASPPA